MFIDNQLLLSTENVGLSLVYTTISADGPFSQSRSHIMFLCSSLRQLDLRTAGTKLKVVSTVTLRLQQFQRLYTQPN